MQKLDDIFLKNSDVFHTDMTRAEYCKAVAHYVRMIWDDSAFPEKELDEAKEMILESFQNRCPVAETANRFIDEIQNRNDSPEIRQLVDRIFRRSANKQRKSKPPAVSKLPRAD